MLDSGRELAEAMKMAGLETVLPPRVADLFARILDTEYDAVALLNSEPRIIYVNQNYERIVGLKKEEVLYKRADELVKQGKWRRAPSLEVLATKKPCSFFQKAPSGADLLVTASPLLDETGNVVVIIDNLRDITDLNRLKEESLRYQLRSNRYERETLELRARNSYSTHIVARSPEMDKVVERAIRASLVDATVLITGESGVGKNVLARFIHEYGTRGKGPFIQVNCSAIPQSLLESELFGYEEGAFSGARRQGKVGLLEVASGGTVLLDEVADLPLSAQAKMLSFLQEKRFFRVGGTREISVDVRVIAATNANLEEKVKGKEFREDLYYRLNVIRIRIPPLRERVDDIIPLAVNFLEKFNAQYGKRRMLTFSGEAALRAYSWPGNVRELQNVMERLVILSDYDQIDSQQVDAAIGDKVYREPATYAGASDLIPLPQAYKQLERELLQIAAERFTTARQIAKALRISHPTVIKKLREYDIHLRRRRQAR